MFAKTALMSALACSAFLLSVPPTTAHHDLCQGNTHQLTGTVSGTVWSGNPDHWLYVNTAPASIVQLRPSGGDADLYVYDATCTVLICSSTAAGSAVDTCAVPAGTYQVRVLYFSSTSGQVPYTLSG